MPWLDLGFRPRIGVGWGGVGVGQYTLTYFIEQKGKSSMVYNCTDTIVSVVGNLGSQSLKMLPLESFKSLRFLWCTSDQITYMYVHICMYVKVEE